MIGWWVDGPVPPDVRRAVERIAAAGDVVRVAVMPDVHLADELCVGVAVATRERLYPAAIGRDVGCGVDAARDGRRSCRATARRGRDPRRLRPRRADRAASGELAARDGRVQLVRRMSRSDARGRFGAKALHEQMRGVWYDTRRSRQLVEEAPGAYKDIGRVMRAQHELTRIVTRLEPVLNFKGR